MKKTLKRPNYAEELLKIIQSPLKNEALLDRLNDYHERDIADALELLSMFVNDLNSIFFDVWFE